MEHLIYDNYAILTDDNDKELKNYYQNGAIFPLKT